MEFLHLATTRVARGGHTQLGSTIGTFLALANIHSKSEKVCGTAFSVKKNGGKVRAIFGPFWVISGHFLGHFVAYLDKFAESSIFLRPRWGRGARF